MGRRGGPQEEPREGRRRWRRRVAPAAAESGDCAGRSRDLPNGWPTQACFLLVAEPDFVPGSDVPGPLCFRAFPLPASLVAMPAAQPGSGKRTVRAVRSGSGPGLHHPERAQGGVGGEPTPSSPLALEMGR